MINIKDLGQTDVGQWVAYTPEYQKRQFGRIKFWNDKWIFVVYHCNDNWEDYQNYTGVATSPNDLKYVKPIDLYSYFMPT